MKYKNDYVTKLEAVLNLIETLQKTINSNTTLTREEMAVLTGNMHRLVSFVLDRIELESN